MNTTNEHKQMWESLQDPNFRKQLIDEHINVGIAFQIHGLRKRQGLKQKQLAEKLGEKKQPLISSWESPNYGKYTLGTLKDLAKAFDVGLLVRFVPFSTLVDWTLDLTREKIAPPSFGEEEKYHIVTLPTIASKASNPVGDTKDADAYDLRLSRSMPVLSASTATTKREEVLSNA